MSLEQLNPLVTVYIPTYNRVDLLKRAVESVRQQTYQNLEIIIVDDCSTDNTHQYLEEVSKQDSRIRYFIKEKNSGACVSRNIAIANAKGEFITGLDDDDYFLNSRISDFLKYAKINKILFSHYIEIDKFNKYRKIKSLKKSIMWKDLLFYNYIGNQIFFHKDLKEVLLYDYKLNILQDLEAWLNILKNKNIRAIGIESYSYFIDKSHPHERISKFNNERVIQALNYISEKHKLNFIQKLLIKTYIIGYVPKAGNILVYILKFLMRPKKIFFNQIFYVIFKILKNE